MLERLMPDFFFDTFRGVTVEFLRKEGICFLLVDIDNTLAPYEEPIPSDAVRAWVKALLEDGVKLAFVSNNHKERVELFARDLAVPAFADCGKPLKKKPLAIMAEMGAEQGATATLGDQIFTDVWCARNLGVRAILVPPIRDKKTFFFRFKRALEKPILKKYHKKNGR